MSSTIVKWKNVSKTNFVEEPKWMKSEGYRIHLLFLKEADGISVIVLNLPGTGSCGATEQEAEENAKEAVCATIQVYVDSGEEVPWKDTSTIDIPVGAKSKWITIDTRSW
jgi:predicted RNase H-like HicB family nuclease